MQLDTRDQLSVVDVYHELGSIVRSCQTEEVNKPFLKEAEKQLLEIHELLYAVHAFNNILELK